VPPTPPLPPSIPPERAMHIKEVIIDGFKSYAHRTVVENFDPQFNAITGLTGPPHGAGGGGAHEGQPHCFACSFGGGRRGVALSEKRIKEKDSPRLAEAQRFKVRCKYETHFPLGGAASNSIILFTIF